LVAGKVIGLLHEVVANPAMIALLADPRLPESARMENEAQDAARTLGWQFLLLNASTPSEIDAAFGGSKLLPWRPVTPFPPSTPTANLSKRAG
jgi:hypothetical protein